MPDTVTYQAEANLLHGQELHRLVSLLCNCLTSSAEGTLAFAAQITSACVEHIRGEDDIMLAVGYPEIRGHRWQHEELIADLRRISAMIADGSRRSAVELAHSVRIMIVDHIEHADNELLRWILERPEIDRGPLGCTGFRIHVKQHKPLHAARKEHS